MKFCKECGIEGSTVFYRIATHEWLCEDCEKPENKVITRTKASTTFGIPVDDLIEAQREKWIRMITVPNKKSSAYPIRLYYVEEMQRLQRLLHWLTLKEFRVAIQEKLIRYIPGSKIFDDNEVRWLKAEMNKLKK
jgi:NMD protein affecting ribosome stability and mRNA decay